MCFSLTFLILKCMFSGKIKTYGLIVNESIISNRLFGSLLCRQMFSSYPTTTLVPSRRAQTPPVSSLPTSPSDEVGRRQSLTSPDSQANRPQNRSGTCKRVELSAILVQRSVDSKNSGVSGCSDRDCLFHAALSDPSSRLSTSPPPPAIAVPLLEMGFSLRQITKALEATGQSFSPCTDR